MCAKAALHCVLPRAAPPALQLTALPCCRRWRGPASFAPCQPKPGRTCWCFWWSCWAWRPAKARPSTVRRRGRPQSSRCRRCSPRLSLSLAGASSWPASPGSPREQTAITSRQRAADVTGGSCGCSRSCVEAWLEGRSCHKHPLPAAPGLPHRRAQRDGAEHRGRGRPRAQPHPHRRLRVPAPACACVRRTPCRAAALNAAPSLLPHPPDADGDQWNAIQKVPGQLNETILAQGLDFVVDQACRVGVRLLLTLSNTWPTGGNFGSLYLYTTWAGAWGRMAACHWGMALGPAPSRLRPRPRACGPAARARRRQPI